MRKALSPPGVGFAVGSFRDPGQAPKLLLGRNRLRMRYDTSALSHLTAPPVPLLEPVIPGSTADIIREPSDVLKGLPLDYDTHRQLESKLRDLMQEPNILTFRKSVLEALRTVAPENLSLRTELQRRAVQLYKATAGTRFDRRPRHEGERLIIQKSLTKGLKIDVGGVLHEVGGDGQLRPVQAQPTVHQQKPSGGGWMPIPKTIHPGGMRRRHLDGYEYWYPDTGMVSTAKPEAAAAQPVVAPHVELVAMIPGSRYRSKDKRLNVYTFADEPGEDKAAWYASDSQEDHRLSGLTYAQAVAAINKWAHESPTSKEWLESPMRGGPLRPVLPSKEVPSAPAEAATEPGAPSAARDQRLLVPADRGPRVGEQRDEAAGGGTGPQEALGRTPQEVEQALAAPPAGPGFVPDSRPVEIKAPDKNPAITLHADLLPEIPEAARLPDHARVFPKPAPLVTSSGKTVGYIKELYPHQTDAAERILAAWQHHDGILLQDDAGLGKTNAALAAMVAHGGARNLIVLPTAGKEGLREQWAGPTAAGLYGIDLRGKSRLSATEPGWYVVSYDELFTADTDPQGKPILGKDGKPKSVYRKDLFDGEWDTIAFDESHSMANPYSKRGAAARDLQDRAKKVVYMSATPFTNVVDMNYLKKLGLWSDFIGQDLSQGDIKVKAGGEIETDEQAFAHWAQQAGANVRSPTYRAIKNPGSHLPMSVIAATLHVDGLSVKRQISMEGTESKFGMMTSGELNDTQRGAFDTANELMDAATGIINSMLIKALYTGWARQYWETLKVDKAIALGKQARAEGKQVAFFTSYKLSNHEHLRAFPKILRNRAERLLESGADNAESQAAALESAAQGLDEILTKLPPGESAVTRLVDAFGGPNVVAEIHGNTRKKPHLEQNSYQAGEKKVVVATMSKGGTGISLHDTKGDAPRVQINLSLPWSGREFNQVGGRSHRLGSKTGTTMHWLVGDHQTEQHNAAVVGKRLRDMGALTSGDPELTVSSTALAAWEFGAAGSDSDDANDSVKAIEEVAAEVENPNSKLEQLSEEAEASRQEFRNFAEARRAGRNVMKERYEHTVVRKRQEQFRDARYAAQQMRQFGVGVKWRPGLGYFEIDVRQSPVGAKTKYRGLATYEMKLMRAATIGGKAQSYGTKNTLAFWVPAENMGKLAEQLGAHREKVDLRTAETPEHLEKWTPAQKLEDELSRKNLTATALGDGTVLIRGNTYKWFQRDAFLGIGNWDREVGGYIMAEGHLPDLVERVGGELDPEHKLAREEAKVKEEAAPGHLKAEVVVRPLTFGSFKQKKYADAIRGKALRALEAFTTPEASALRERLAGEANARWILDAMDDLGWSRPLNPEQAYRRLIGGSLGKSTDADLARLRPRLMVRPTTAPLELVWMYEEVPDELHTRPVRSAPGWGSDDLDKGAGHKYLKRIPTGRAERRWRYVYRVPVSGLSSSSDLVEGSKFKVTHQGKLGHFEVKQVHHDTGVVTVRHDESGRIAHLHERDLHRMLQSQHAKRTEAAVETRPAQKRQEPGPPLPRAKMSDLGTGGYDQIEGFSADPTALESQAVGLPQDRDYAVIEQPGGYVLASRSKAPSGVSKYVGDLTAVFLRNDAGTGISTVPAEWLLVEADQVTPSHHALSFNKNPAYPEGVQERRYDTVRAEQGKIERIAHTLEPALLANTNPDAINGTPIVNEKGIVLGGNGRTMGMQRAYALYPEKAAQLKTFLTQHAKAFGLAPAQVAGMKQPILVRRIQAGDDATKLTRLGRRMNESLTQGLDPKSEQVAVSKFVTPELVDSLTHHMEPDQTLADFLSRSTSAPFVKDLEAAGIIDQYNRAQYVNEDTGLLNDEGRQRIERVLAARMVPDAGLLDHMPQSWRESLARSTPALLQAEKNGWDLRAGLMAAMKMDRDMTTRGYKRTPGDRKAYLGQQDLFEQKKAGPLGIALLEVFQDRGDQVRTVPRAFRQVALEASRQRHDYGDNLSMFARPALTLEQALSEAFKTGRQETLLAASWQPLTDLRKAASAREAMQWYRDRTVVWELDNLMRGAIAASGYQGNIDGEKVLQRLKNFVLDQAKTDRYFARALGAAPLNDTILRALVRAYARANVATIVKSLLLASLRDNLEKAGYPVGTVRQWAVGQFRKVGPNEWEPVPGTATGGGAADSDETKVYEPLQPSRFVGPEEPKTKEQATKEAPAQAIAVDPKKPRVGVDPMQVPPPPAIPRLPNLLPDEQEAETGFADAYEANADAMVAEYRQKLQMRELGDGPNVYSTDDAKLLSPHYNQPGTDPVNLPGGGVANKNLAARGLYNVAVHQTANAIAKKAFLGHLDELAQLPPGDPKRTVLATSGGVASGKGYALSNIPEAKSIADQVGAVWDAAGEQMSTENAWVLQECKKRGLRPVFAYIDADSQETWENPQRGVVERATKTGRMVDAHPYADSYAGGAENWRDFHTENRNDPEQGFLIIQNRKGGPKLLDDFPKEALVDRDTIYRRASKVLDDRADKLPEHVYRGGTIGRRIWGHPE